MMTAAPKEDVMSSCEAFLALVNEVQYFQLYNFAKIRSIILPCRKIKCFDQINQ